MLVELGTFSTETKGFVNGLSFDDGISGGGIKRVSFVVKVD